MEDGSPAYSDELEVLEEVIRYCPICGFESTKNFDNYMEGGGDWVCEDCDYRVEAYILPPFEEAEEEEEESSKENHFTFPSSFFTLLGIFLFIYFFFQK